MPDVPFPRPRTLREQAAQCVMVRLGSNLPPTTSAEDDAERVAALLSRCPVGGVILFRGAHPGLAATLAALQRESRTPLLVVADVERGVGQQVEGATEFPHARALAATADPEHAARILARTTAREARACGIHWTFAPVADVNVEPTNPIIGIRAFGATPAAVAPCVRAYVKTARAEGLLTTAKHFPGHGRTTTDSHAEQPVVTASRDALDRVDLVPFRAAIGAGVDAIMTAHVAFPALDAEDRPATASPPILRERLRDAMGFGGVVVSDSLLMEGADVDSDPGTHAATLLRAGVDVLLDPGDPEAVVEGIVSAVERGALEASRVRTACERVLRCKARVHERWGASAWQPGGQDVGTPEAQARAASLARDAMTVQQAAPGAWPLPPRRVDGGDALHVVRLPSGAQPADPSPLETALRRRYPRVQIDMLAPDMLPPDMLAPEASTGRARAVHRAATGAKHLVVVCEVAPAAWQAFGLSDAQEQWLREAVAARNAAGRATVVVAMGSPEPLHTVPDAAVHVCTYSTSGVSQQALAAQMAGGAQTED